MGVLTGGQKCHMLTLRIAYVPCHYVWNFHVDFKVVPCCTPNLRSTPCILFILFFLSLGILLHVDFKKWSCRSRMYGSRAPRIEGGTPY